MNADRHGFGRLDSRSASLPDSFLSGEEFSPQKILAQGRLFVLTCTTIHINLRSLRKFSLPYVTFVTHLTHLTLWLRLCPRCVHLWLS